MKSKIMILLLGAVLITIILIAGCGLFSPREPHESLDKRSQHAFHGRFHKRNAAEYFLKHLDEKVESLDLTGAQMAKYQEMRSKIKSDMMRMRENRETFVEKIRNEINRDNPDMTSLSRIVKDHLERMPPFIAGHIDSFVELYNTLDENQKGKIIDNVREKLGKLPT